MIVSFYENPKTTMISCYVPEKCSKDNIGIGFYNELLSLTRYTLKHNIAIITGNFNWFQTFVSLVLK